MEHLYADRREGWRDENVSSECSSNSEENGHPIFGVSELKLELEKITRKMPLILESPKGKNSPCRQNSCPCSGELAYPYYINFVSPSRDFVPFSADLEQRSYNIRRRIFYKATSLLNMPSNLRSLDQVIRSLRDRRKPSVTDIGDFVDESSSLASTGNSASVSPSRILIFESLEAAFKVRALHKGSFIAPRLPRSRIVPFKKSASESSFSEKMVVQSRSSSTSMSSSLISTGLLHCMWKNGLPYFEFSVEDDPTEIYVAHPLKVQSTADEALDYIYVFHARNISRFVGKMKVSSSVILSSKELNCIETEFVLFGTDDGLSREMQRSSSSLAKTKGLSKKVARMLTPSYSPKRKISHKVTKSCSQFDDAHAVIARDFSGVDELVPPLLLTDDFPPNFELAAIVVKDYQHKSNKKESSVGGWGLKFLAKSEVGNSDAINTLSADESCAQNRRKSSRCANVVIPSGLHGGPATSSGGPSSLAERWKSGGLCDCGGWDLGCPITVLSDHSTSSEASPRIEPQECNSIDLFVEGAEHGGEPAFRLLNAGEDLYLIRFTSTLSALQCFSIAVATIHSRTPHLHPKL